MKTALANQRLRTELKNHGVALWQIAEAQKVCEMTLTRRWRHELSEPEKASVRGIIREIVAKRNENSCNEEHERD